VLTRVFSVILWYHYGFLVVSLALMGISASGIVVYLFPERFPRERIATQCSGPCLAFAATLVAAVLLFHALVTFRSTWPLSPFELVLVMVLMVIPFFFGGLVVAVPLPRCAERIGRLYAADLVGAAAGAALVVPLLSWLDGHRALICSAILACLAAPGFGLGSRRRPWVAASVIGLVVVLVGLAGFSHFDTSTIRFSKRGRCGETPGRTRSGRSTSSDRRGVSAGTRNPAGT
jgi:hypothetical protein